MVSTGALPQERFDQIRQLIYYQDHLDRCIEDVFGDALEPHQLEMARICSVSDSVCAVTSHGVGKTFMAARLGLAFLFTYERPKVVTTAPTWRQVKDLLWTEVHAAMRTARLDRVFWDGKFKLNTTRLELAPEVFMTGEASDEPTKMEGYHAPNILYIVDEAKGVEDAAFAAIEGALTSGKATGGRSMRLYVSTPGECVGKHYRIVSGEDPGWSVIHVSGEGKRRPDPQWVEERAAEWGRDSWLYRTRVLGEYDPRGGNLCVNPDWVKAAYKRALPPAGEIQVGVDVAREGDDRSVIAVRQGDSLLSLIAVHKRDVEWLITAVEGVVNRLRERFALGKGNIAIKVDDGGVGGGLTDGLKRHGYRVVPVKAGAVALDEEHYHLRRDELWIGFGQRLKAGGVDLSRVPAHLRRELEGELAAPGWTLDQRDRFVVEPTKSVKKRIKRSPDLATGVILCYAATGRPQGHQLPVNRFFRQGEAAQRTAPNPVQLDTFKGPPLLVGHRRR